MGRAGPAVVFRSAEMAGALAAVGASPRRSRGTPSTVAAVLRIGEVSRRSGLSVKTLRFYERRGLLLPSGRTPAGYRVYTEADLPRLDFIREAKALGLTLAEIRELVESTLSDLPQRSMHTPVIFSPLQTGSSRSWLGSGLISTTPWRWPS